MAKPRQISTNASSHAILLRNVERLPIAVLSTYEESSFRLQGADGTEWLIERKDQGQLPRAVANDVYVALGQCLNQKLYPLQPLGADFLSVADANKELRTVRLPYRELCDIMGKEPSGPLYETIDQALTDLKAVTIRATTVNRRKGSVTENIGLFDRTATIEQGGQKYAEAVFDLELLRLIVGKEYRLFDTNQYRSLDGPIARRLLRYLDVERYRGSAAQPSINVDLKELGSRLPLQPTSPSQIKRLLDPAHEELIAQGVLSVARYVEVEVPGKRRPRWLVHYEFGSSDAPAARQAREVANLDLELLVEDILEVLKDEHSRAFYFKVVKSVHEPVVRGALGVAREAIQGGASIDVARRMFTGTVKARAKASGVDL